MAGSFGYEKEHYATSMAIGEMVLFPTLRKAMDNAFHGSSSDTSSTGPRLTLVAAPGTSCRHQILDGTGFQARHPLEILYDSLK